MSSTTYLENEVKIGKAAIAFGSFSKLKTKIRTYGSCVLSKILFRSEHIEILFYESET